MLIQNLTDFPAIYNTKDVEQGWYNVWQRNKYFASSRRSNEDKKPFNIILPPPNITGVLHLGHALTATIQDALARWSVIKRKSSIFVSLFLFLLEKFFCLPDFCTQCLS